MAYSPARQPSGGTTEGRGKEVNFLKASAIPSGRPCVHNLTQGPAGKTAPLSGAARRPGLRRSLRVPDVGGAATSGMMPPVGGGQGRKEVKN